MRSSIISDVIPSEKEDERRAKEKMISLYFSENNSLDSLLNLIKFIIDLPFLLADSFNESKYMFPVLLYVMTSLRLMMCTRECQVGRTYFSNASKIHQWNMMLDIDRSKVVGQYQK